MPNISSSSTESGNSISDSIGGCNCLCLYNRSKRNVGKLYVSVYQGGRQRSRSKWHSRFDIEQHMGYPSYAPTPPPTQNQTVSFTLVGGSGATGGSFSFLFFFSTKGGTGGLGATVSGTFTAPAYFPGTVSTPIFFGTEVGLAGSPGPKTTGVKNGPGTTGGGTGYAVGGAAGNDSGGGGGASAICVMPDTATGSGTCNSSMPTCATSPPWAVETTTGCVFATAAGGGGGGQANLFPPGNGETRVPARRAPVSRARHSRAVMLSTSCTTSSACIGTMGAAPQRVLRREQVGTALGSPPLPRMVVTGKGRE